MSRFVGLIDSTLGGFSTMVSWDHWLSSWSVFIADVDVGPAVETDTYESSALSGCGLALFDSLLYADRSLVFAGVACGAADILRAESGIKVCGACWRTLCSDWASSAALCCADDVVPDDGAADIDIRRLVSLGMELNCEVLIELFWGLEDAVAAIDIRRGVSFAGEEVIIAGPGFRGISLEAGAADIDIRRGMSLDLDDAPADIDIRRGIFLVVDKVSLAVDDGAADIDMRRVVFWTLSGVVALFAAGLVVTIDCRLEKWLEEPVARGVWLRAATDGPCIFDFTCFVLSLDDASGTTGRDTGAAIDSLRRDASAGPGADAMDILLGIGLAVSVTGLAAMDILLMGFAVLWPPPPIDILRNRSIPPTALVSQLAGTMLDSTGAFSATSTQKIYYLLIFTFLPRRWW